MVLNNKERILKMSYDFTRNKDKPVKIESKVTNVSKRNNSVCKVDSTAKNETTITMINQNQSQLSNTNTNNNTNTIAVPLDNISINSKQIIKQSLYNLTKSRVTLINNTPTQNATAKRERNKTRFKESYNITFNTTNTNNDNTNKACNAIRSKTLSDSKIGSGSEKNYTSINTHQIKKANLFVLNTHQPQKVNKTQYYSQNKDRKRREMIMTSDKSIDIKMVKRNKPKSILLNNKLCTKVNDNNKHEISIETYDYYANNNTNLDRGTSGGGVNGSGSKTQRSSRSANSNKRDRDSDSNSKINSKIPSFIFSNQQLLQHSNTKTNNNDTVKKIRTQYIDLTRNEHRLTPKNDETIKLIKLSLDDNLKLMFNFSYEQFLSKESESLSKKSQEANELSAEIESHTTIFRRKHSKSID